MQLLTEHRQQQRKARLAAASWDDLDLAFAYRVGTPLNSDNVRCIWSDMLADADVEPVSRTFTTRLRDAGRMPIRRQRP